MLAESERQQPALTLSLSLRFKCSTSSSTCISLIKYQPRLCHNAGGFSIIAPTKTTFLVEVSFLENKVK